MYRIIKKILLYKSLIIILLIFIFSCKVVEDDVVGVYYDEVFPRVTMTLNSDSSFEYLVFYNCPFLYHHDRPVYYFYGTSGTWNLQGKTLVLNSTSDSLNYGGTEMHSSDTIPSEYCKYVLFDILGDTIPIYSVKSKIGYSYGFGRTFTEYSHLASQKDSLIFFIWGYPPYKTINKDIVGVNKRIILKPIFIPDYFSNDVFRIKSKKIKDIEYGTTYKKILKVRHGNF